MKSYHTHTHEIFLGVFHSSITWLPKHERECIGRRICRSIQNWSFRHLQTSKTPASTHPHFLDSFVGLVACTHTHINIYIFMTMVCFTYGI